jgi:hypothetical protein
MIPGTQSNLAGVAKHFRVANADGYRCSDLLAGLGLPSIYMKRPGIGVQCENVVPAGELPICNFQRLLRRFA